MAEIKNYTPAEFAELKDKFKALKEKMLPMVYELGFLKK